MENKTSMPKMAPDSEIKMAVKDHLPLEIPVFPLNGLLLLPGMWLPLHFFEPRYLNMVSDALSSDGCIGVIQPLLGNTKTEGFSQDLQKWQLNDEKNDSSEIDPPLYQIGCLGWIAEKKETDEGNYLVALQGLKRFAVKTEILPKAGYRRVRVSFSSFMQDGYEQEAKLDLKQLMREMKKLTEQNNLHIPLDKLDQLPPAAIVNGLSMSLPFQPAEKQGLLEASSVKARLNKLVSLIRMENDTSFSQEEPLMN